MTLNPISNFDFTAPQNAAHARAVTLLVPMKIISLNLGSLEKHSYFGRKKVTTGGHKRPVAGAVLRLEGFEGDTQADLDNHGGEDKAVCVYSFDHYQYWAAALGQQLEPGVFSENLTIEGVREKEVCLGDVFRVGDTLGQISQPRVPCTKLAGKLGRKDLPDLIHATGYSGFYLRVLSEGMVKPGDPFEVVRRHPLGVTVEFANQVLYHQRSDTASLKLVLEIEALALGWRKSLEKRL